MITASKTTITVKAEVNEVVEKVWKYWTDPKHIVNWAHASDDWHAPVAENDVRTGGKFYIRMESRDGSDGFDFNGVYDSVVLLKQIKYTIDDGRNVRITFDSDDSKTLITMVVETEAHNPVDLQQQGWQAILNNFRKYVERCKRLERLHFSTIIDASTQKVYSTMIDEKKYSEWTSVFNPTSRFKGSWEKGSKIHFIGESPEGNLGGMVSIIRENIPFRYISIEHIGILENDKELLAGPQVETWAGAFENYKFKDQDGKTLVSVELDITDEYKQYFMDTWPQALQKLKEICESD